jgi:hypothetical protein
MILIAHRGNILGPNPKDENRPEYIVSALEQGYDAEIDLRVVDGQYYLGHDEPQYLISESWISTYAASLWIHCKNIKAIEEIRIKKKWNYFWHESDLLTITSQGDFWVYPGKQPVANSIDVMPELHDPTFIDLNMSVKGICSDYVAVIKDKLYEK